MKNIKKAVLGLATLLTLGSPVGASAKTSQLAGQEFVSLGVNVLYDTNTYANTINLLNANEVPNEHRVTVDGPTLNKYLHDGSDHNTQIWSSAKIEFHKTGQQTGVQVNVVTPQNIQLVRPETYRNAAITAGISNATITVASQNPVTGEGALGGIYAIMDAKGVLDQRSAELAQEEIGIINQAQQQDQIDPTVMNAVMSDVKGEVVQAVSNGDIVNGDQIINNVVNNYGIQLTPELINSLVAFANSFSETDVASDKETVTQLSDLSNDLFTQGAGMLDGVSARINDIASNPEFQQQAKGILSRIWDAIVNFFRAIGNMFGSFFNNETDLNGLQTVDQFQQSESVQLDQFSTSEGQLEYQEPVNQEPVYQEPVNQEPVYEVQTEEVGYEEVEDYNNY